MKTCLAERSVTPVNGADLRFCRNHPVFPLFQECQRVCCYTPKNFDGCFGEWRCGMMPSGKRNGVFMEMLRILCLEFAFAVLLAFIVCLVGGLLFMVVG